MIQLHCGDCLEIMKTLRDDGVRVDAVVTDPPYHLTSGNPCVDWGAMPNTSGRGGPKGPTNAGGRGHKTGFMGKEWDGGDVAFRMETWLLALELLKPGGHLLAFSGTRTQHRVVCAIEDAGFEVRDQIGWLYGTGFPKSLDVSKAIDKAAGAEREVVGPGQYASRASNSGQQYEGWSGDDTRTTTAPATDAARQWAGWGTALKPAWEPICVARKPLQGTVAANVMQHGTGALNIDASRVPTTDSLGGGRLSGPTDMSGTCGGPEWDRPWMHDEARRGEYAERTADKVAKAEALGRWPANVILEEGCVDEPWARYFYSAKASKADRAGSKHPTVKNLALMRYLCRLVTPPGGLILDPFAGSGTTLEAAALEGFGAIGIEIDPAYAADIRRRMQATRDRLGLFAPALAAE
jgi:DNA modification methylase